MISAKRGGVGLSCSAIFFSERSAQMRPKKIGTMDFHGSVDITDPCYNRDVWCRMTDVKIRKWCVYLHSVASQGQGHIR